MLINCSICLTDIPRCRIKLAHNGKKYLNITIQDLRESPDQYGNTHSVFCTQTKEERDAQEKRTYLGNGKEVVFQSQRMSAEDVEHLPMASNNDDLPF